MIAAEAVHDLVAAETDAQRRQALRQLEGGLGDLYRDWSDRLRIALARQEALIDFPDEDLPPDVEAELLASLHSLRAEIAAHLTQEFTLRGGWSYLESNYVKYLNAPALVPIDGPTCRCGNELGSQESCAGVNRFGRLNSTPSAQIPQISRTFHWAK